MAVEYARLRPVLLDFLNENRQGDINLMVGLASFRGFFESKDLNVNEVDQSLVTEIFHDFYREGIIDSGDGKGSAAMQWPFYRVTTFGKKVIESTEYQPYDPDGYLARLKSEIADLDDTIVRYLEQALGCLRARHLLASAVMRGCAAEKAMLLLIEAYGDAIKDTKKKAKYEKDTSHWMIGRKYDALWKRLEPMAKKLPRELREGLDVMLSSVFNLIRTTRNEAGHPTGKQVDRETVRANLILFPGYCRRVHGLIDHFKKTPVA